MLTSVYIVGSVLHYIFFSRYLFDVGRKLEKEKQLEKEQIWVFKLGSLIEKANLAVCGLLFLLKCAGAIPWW